MSVTAIRDAGETLVDLLRGSLAPGLVAANQIALLSPADAEEEGEIRLTVFLYSLTPAVELRNEPPIQVSPTQQRRAPLSLDLYYLITAFAPDTIPDPTERSFDAHRLLGAAMRVFYDHGTLTGNTLRGEFPRDTELRLTLQPITVEDMTRIWSVFPDNAYRPSVSYLVTPVGVDSLDTLGLARVVSKQTDFDRIVPHPVGAQEGR